MDLQLRKICPDDNPAIAAIVRSSLEEFSANQPGTAYYDESIDHLSDSFEAPRHAYFVAVLDKKVIGGGGIFPTKGLPEDICELVKMYLLPEARGRGIGKRIIHACITEALSMGYQKIYLETMDELSQAVQVYEKLGFKKLSEPLGDSGHYNCKIWMLKEIAS